ncbi:MAG: DNA modification methylase [Candidatus Binatia bacterium]
MAGKQRVTEAGHRDDARCTRQEAEDALGDFRPQQQNANTHTSRGMGALERSMRTDGYSTPMVAAADFEVFDGSARLETSAVLFDGIAPIVIHSDGTRPVIHVRDDIPSTADPRAKRLALAANRIAQLNLEWDPALLTRLLAELPELTPGLWTDEELRVVVRALEHLSSVDAEPQIDRAEELRKEWGVETGQLWRLGDSCLLCGNSTKPEDVARLMEGEKYTLLITDPPYGVSYAAKNAFLNAVGRGNRIQKEIEGDHRTPEEMSAFWLAAFSTIREAAAPGAAYYVTGPQGGDLLLRLLLALRDSGFPLRHMLIWSKNNHVLGRCDYHYKHEPIVYGWVEGGHKFYGSHSEFSVWEIDKPQKSDLHPTTKPTELYLRALMNSSAPGDIVADFFGGSGTMIIAAEQAQRSARVMELDAGYAAVTLQRYLDATGKQPVLLEAA